MWAESELGFAEGIKYLVRIDCFMEDIVEYTKKLCTVLKQGKEIEIMVQENKMRVKMLREKYDV